MGSTKAVKKKMRVSGVLRAISVQNAANPRSAPTGEIRIAAMIVPRISASTPDDDEQEESHTETRPELGQERDQLLHAASSPVIVGACSGGGCPGRRRRAGPGIRSISSGRLPAAR